LIHQLLTSSAVERKWNVCGFSVGDIRVVVVDSGQAGFPGSDEGGIVQTAAAAGTVRGKSFFHSVTTY